MIKYLYHPWFYLAIIINLYSQYCLQPKDQFFILWFAKANTRPSRPSLQALPSFIHSFTFILLLPFFDWLICPARPATSAGRRFQQILRPLWALSKCSPNPPCSWASSLIHNIIHNKLAHLPWLLSTFNKISIIK